MLALRKWRFMVAIAALGIMLGAAGAWAANKEVRISEQNWTGSTMICQVMKYVLEKKLDVPAKVIQLNGAATWAGMEKGDVDVFSEVWETAEGAGLQKYVHEKKVAKAVMSYPNAPQGWYIPKYVADEYGIKTIDDLKGKEKIFDINSDGKGDIWVGPSSWKANEFHRIRIRDYGLDFEANGVEQWAWLATLREAVRKKQPVIFFYWEPEWLFTQYDLVKIEEPPFDPKKWVYVEKHPEQSKITCAMQDSNVWVAFSEKLKDRSPKAYQFFENWHMPIKEVNKLITMVTDLPDQPKMTPEAAAKKWVEENPELVNSWLKGIN